MVLKKVVLPAPFGPIRLTIAPRGMVKSTLLTATRPPKRLVISVAAQQHLAAAPAASSLRRGGGRRGRRARLRLVGHALRSASRVSALLSGVAHVVQLLLALALARSPRSLGAARPCGGARESGPPGGAASSAPARRRRSETSAPRSRSSPGSRCGSSCRSSLSQPVICIEHRWTASIEDQRADDHAPDVAHAAQDDHAEDHDRDVKSNWPGPMKPSLAA